VQYFEAIARRSDHNQRLSDEGEVSHQIRSRILDVSEAIAKAIIGVMGEVDHWVFRYEAGRNRQLDAAIRGIGAQLLVRHKG
jgi:hypothetical protein